MRLKIIDSLKSHILVYALNIMYCINYSTSFCKSFPSVFSQEKSVLLSEWKLVTHSNGLVYVNTVINIKNTSKSNTHFAHIKHITLLLYIERQFLPKILFVFNLIQNVMSCHCRFKYILKEIILFWIYFLSVVS